jgi:hypothetical protein
MNDLIDQLKCAANEDDGEVHNRLRNFSLSEWQHPVANCQSACRPRVSLNSTAALKDSGFGHKN